MLVFQDMKPSLLYMMLSSMIIPRFAYNVHCCFTPWKESKTCSFWILNSMPWIPDSRYWIPVFVNGTWILDSGILDSKTQDSRFCKQHFSEFRFKFFWNALVFIFRYVLWIGYVYRLCWPWRNFSQFLIGLSAWAGVSIKIEVAGRF